jgi:predicted dehydrogenase
MNMPVFPYQQIAQLDDFATAVSKNDTPIASGAEGLKDIKLIEGILRAAETGKRIKLI